MTITTEQLDEIERRADSVPWMDSAVLLRLVAIARAALSVRNQLLNIRVTYCDPCRCLVWIDDAWISHRAFDLRQLAIDAKRLSENLSAEFGSDPIVWRREYLGQWVDVAPTEPQYVFVNPTTYQRFVDLFRDPSRQRLRGTRAQRKRKRAALTAARG